MIDSSFSFTFPKETVLVVNDAPRNRIYYATDDTIFEVSSGKRHRFSELKFPTTILISPQGNQLLVDYVLMDAATLRPLHRFETGQTWWEGQKPCLLPPDSDKPEFLADTSGKYFLAAHCLGPGTEKNGWCPDYRLELVEHLPSGKRYRQKICDTGLDPGSTGFPCHFGAWDAQSAVFGIPWGGATGDDYLCYMLQGKAHQCLKDKNGFDLYFEKQPLRTKSAIVGLACANGKEGMMGRVQASYLYRLNAQQFILEPVDKRTVLVTIDRRGEVLLGIRIAKGVVLAKPKGRQ